MTTITCLVNNTGEMFDRNFDDVEEARKFIIKLRYSKKLKRVSIAVDTREEYDYLQWYF